MNDVSGGLADPAILEVVADSQAAYVAMHWRAHSETMQDQATYDNPGGVVAAVRDELAARLDAISAAGIPLERIVLDPGLGFAKRAEHNWELLRSQGVIESLGPPVQVGASRKSFLGSLLADTEGTPRPVGERESAHLALMVLLAQRGTWGVRGHDVRATVDAVTLRAEMDRV